MSAGHGRPLLPGGRPHHHGQPQPLCPRPLRLRSHEGCSHREPRGPVRIQTPSSCTCSASIDVLNLLLTWLTSQFMAQLKQLEQILLFFTLDNRPPHFCPDFSTFFSARAEWTPSSSPRCSSISSCSLPTPRICRLTWRTTSSRRRHTCCLCHSPRLHTPRLSPQTDQ